MNGRNHSVLITLLCIVIVLLLILMVYLLVRDNDPEPVVILERPTATEKQTSTAGGSVHVHSWAEATCTRPATCTLCGATQGNALGHNWVPATYEQARHCSVCGETSGSPLSRPTGDTGYQASSDSSVALFTSDTSYTKRYSVTVAHSPSRSACETCVGRMREAGYNAFLYQVPGKDGYSILVGIYDSRDDADALAGYLHEAEAVSGVKLDSAYSVAVSLSDSAVREYANPWW